MDKTTICNMALGHIRAGTIADIEEDSLNASRCRTFYDLARKATLEAFDWNFARRRKTLTLLNVTPPDMWLYRYGYPVNCAKVRYLAYPGVKKPLNPIPFDIELDDDGNVKTILTDQINAIAVITSDVENPNLYTFEAVDAVSWRLGAYLAVPCAGSEASEGRCFKWWNYLIGMAQTSDANEGREEKEPDGEFVQSRWSGGFGFDRRWPWFR